ncbi:flagellar basal body rod protein FlgC [Populibacterium corticicola]|jgi:flagellar basal-body rod protein FlgC|uniref:Flagellar basal-body rod protein FlgC n=1 Tax=Populibacterium corticicola TaxID=1812826 RepID=A0ABW5XIT8_9MICO
MTFDALGIASTGMTVNRKWIDAVSDNLSNLNTVRPMDEEAFRAKYIIATAAGYPTQTEGTRVAGVELGTAEGRVVYEPDHPMANEDGYVRYPEIDMSSQMTQLIMAQRAYQANAAVVERARSTYEQALTIGRS